MLLYKSASYLCDHRGPQGDNFHSMWGMMGSCLQVANSSYPLLPMPKRTPQQQHHEVCERVVCSRTRVAHFGPYPRQH